MLGPQSRDLSRSHSDTATRERKACQHIHKEWIQVEKHLQEISCHLLFSGFLLVVNEGLVPKPNRAVQDGRIWGIRLGSRIPRSSCVGKVGDVYPWIPIPQGLLEGVPWSAMESGRGRRKKEGGKDRYKEKAVACISGNEIVRSIRREMGEDKKRGTQRDLPKCPVKGRSRKKRVEKGGPN